MNNTDDKTHQRPSKVNNLLIQRFPPEAADHAEDNLKSRGCTSLSVVERQFGKNFAMNSCFEPRAGTFDCWCDQDK